MFEKIFIIHNPHTGVKDWVSELEIKIGCQKLKNVFGVLYIDDVNIMLQYNIPFQESVMREYNIIGEDNLSLHHVCRLISKAEFMELLDMDAINDSPTHPTWIEVKDGCFFWNKEKGSYEEVIESKNAR